MKPNLFYFNLINILEIQSLWFGYHVLRFVEESSEQASEFAFSDSQATENLNEKMTGFNDEISDNIPLPMLLHQSSEEATHDASSSQSEFQKDI